jgi:ABC-type glycerol-3-phosphate transport system permease component
MGSAVLIHARTLPSQLPRATALVVLLALGVLMVLPFYWMIVTSFQTTEKLISFPPVWFPAPAVIDHYRAALGQAAFGLYYRNSLIVATVSVAVSLLFGLFAGYAFAAIEFPLKSVMFLLILATLMVPIQVTSVSLYMLVARFGWVNTFIGILAPNLGSAFSVFFIRQSVRSVPLELTDSARIDGAGEVRIVLSIIGPLIKTAMATVAMILFIEQWNDFLWPVIVINSEWLRTIPVGISFFRDPYNISFGPLMAATSIGTVPMIAIYLFFQRFIITGVATTGLKM